MVNFIYYCAVSGSSVWELPYGMDEQHPDCLALKVAITEELSSLYSMGVTDFVCNAEYGVPLWTAEAIVAMRNLWENPVRIHLFMPHEGQANLWNDDARERFFNLHAAADSVTTLNRQFHENCYRETDEYMMKRSIMLLTDGGNEYMTEYAKSLNKHVEHIKALIPR